MIKSNLTGNRLDPANRPSPPATNNSAFDRMRNKGSPGPSHGPSGSKFSSVRSALKGGRARSASPNNQVVNDKQVDKQVEIHEQKPGLVIRSAEANLIKDRVEKAGAHKERLSKLLRALEAN